MRNKTLAWVLDSARQLNKPERALLLDVAYHHSLFKQPKSQTKAALISTVNSVFSLFNDKDKDQNTVESGSQKKLRELEDEIKLKHKIELPGNQSVL